MKLDEEGEGEEGEGGETQSTGEGGAGPDIELTAIEEGIRCVQKGVLVWNNIEILNNVWKISPNMVAGNILQLCILNQSFRGCALIYVDSKRMFFIGGWS